MMDWPGHEVDHLLLNHPVSFVRSLRRLLLLLLCFIFLLISSHAGAAVGFPTLPDGEIWAGDPSRKNKFLFLPVRFPRAIKGSAHALLSKT